MVVLKRIVLYGAGGFGRETAYLIDVINYCNPGTYWFLGFLVDKEFYTPNTTINGYPLLGTDDWILNNKEFTSELSRRLGYTLKDTSELVTSLLSDMTRQLEEGNTISIQGFGTFEVKKKAERISVNPTTKQRMLVPPKLVLTYKPSTLLKDKFK